MDSFTISQLQRYSGISVHSIRAWEKRYNALTPSRSEGNTRYYDGKQLRRLLNIASLMNSSHKISELCSLPDAKLHELINRKLEKETLLSEKDELLVTQMVSSALEFNEPLFDKVFSHALLSYGVEATYLRVIYPALKRLGVLWSAAQIAPAQEHFISNLIRQKLNASIDLLPLDTRSKNHWLLFLPENEFHESGLLMANYLVRHAGHRCTYLGANVPFDTLKDAVKMVKPTSLLFFLVTKDDEEEDKALLRMMSQHFTSQKIFVAAEATRFSNPKTPKSISLLHSLQALKEELK